MKRLAPIRDSKVERKVMRAYLVLLGSTTLLKAIVKMEVGRTRSQEEKCETSTYWLGCRNDEVVSTESCVCS